MVKDNMEITEVRDSENNVEELGSKALVSVNENTKAEGEILPCMVADAVNVNKSDDFGESLNELEKHSEDITKTEWKETTDPQTEIKEPKIIEESTGQLDDETKTAEKINSENNFYEQTPNKQSDAKNDVAEQSASNDVEKDDKSTGNGVEGGNPVENEVEANPIGDFSVEKQEDNESTYHNASSKSQLKTTQVPIDEPPSQSAELVKVMPVGDQEKEVAANLNGERAINDVLKHPGKEIHPSSPVAGDYTMNIDTAVEHKGDHPSIPIKHEAATPSFATYSPAKAEDQSGETVKTVSQAALPLMAEDDDGTREEQAAFMKEIESFYRERATDFKPPKFYGQPLNCLKLWRAVIRLGGYDRGAELHIISTVMNEDCLFVTGSKLWRQVGESFHPPKTCTTVSWTFRIFYEKSLLEYEKHKIQSGELQLPVAALNDGADTEGNGFQGAGSGKARRDSAARAMQGWHIQHHFDNGEVGEPVIKDKRVSNTPKREKIVKAIGSLKQKRPNEVEHPSKAARVETSKQLATTVVDVGPPADWVKINVRQMTDSFEVYALVPGLLREEVRVQSDPAGRLVIIGQPEQVDNPWGITPFKKVISLPLRIDPLQTSAVVSLHGRLFIRVPFEQTNG